jgi:hypothetical protein
MSQDAPQLHQDARTHKVEWKGKLDEIASVLVSIKADRASVVRSALAAIRQHTGGSDSSSEPSSDDDGDDDTATEALQSLVDGACQMVSNMMADSSALPEDKARGNCILSSLYYLQQAMVAAGLSSRSLAALASGSDAPDVSDDELVAGVSRFVRMDDNEEMNRVQQLLLYMLNCAQARGYQRLHGRCYRRRFTRDRHDTHSWVDDMSIKDFVYSVTRKEANFDMWLNLTCMRGNASTVCEHLNNCHDVQFPVLKKDRHVFSFRNGVYLAGKDEFLAYGSAGHAALPAGLAAARYFDTDVPTELADADRTLDWYSIPTPNLQKILDFQRMDEETCRWMYVMLGRLLYSVGELDNWQVIPYIKGMASSGKSTILTRVARMFYDAEDVGTLSNNIERKFGLSALHDKFLFIGPEIKSDIQMEQAEFQSIVSGETLQVAIKFQTAQTVNWTVPGILAGNEVPGWVDNAGSINRRILLFTFGHKVDNGDMELGKKLEGELPALLVKCNRAYLEAVARYARTNIWLHVPASFHRAKEELSESINSLVAFVKSGELELNDKAYMPLDEFKTMYKAYCNSNKGFKAITMTQSDLCGNLQGLGLWVTDKKETKRYPPGSTVMSRKADRYVLGACPALLWEPPEPPAGTDPLE